MSSTYHAFELGRAIAIETIPSLNGNTHGVEILARALEKLPKDSDACRGFASEILPYMERAIWALMQDGDPNEGVPF